MKWFLYAMSFFWIANGCCAILYTAETRKAYRSFFVEPGRKILAVITFVIGVLLILAASGSHYPWFIRLLGIITIIKGVFIFLDPFGARDIITDWCLNSLSDQVYRLAGIINVILGTAVMSWIL